jgi:ATPase family associated with various cellular activities (AAA)/Winged helix domain, variant
MQSQASSSAEPQAPTLRFELIDARIRTAVEAVARADPNPTDPFRGLYISDEDALSLARSGTPGDLDERLTEAAALLGLDDLDTAVLGLCAAPEVSPHYGRLYAYLHDDVTRRFASPQLVARLLAAEGVGRADILACFDEEGALRRRGALWLLDAGGPIPLAERGVKVADRLAAFLLGTRLDEPSRFRHQALPELDLGRVAVLEELQAVLAAGRSLPIIVAGPDAQALLSIALGRPLLLVDAADAGNAERMRDAVLAAALDRCTLCFDGLEAIEPAEQRRVQRALAATEERVLICAASRDAITALGDHTAFVVAVPHPTYAERRRTWRRLTAAAQVEDVSAKFRLSIGQIVEAAEAARLASATNGRAMPSAAELDLGARQASSTRLGELAARLEPVFEWDDLVLPERPREVLASISAYLRHRDLVLSDWGYGRTVARTQGLKVLFAGESGTGKTMAGQVLARDLGLDLFRIDLATVVSKYIGETEKNLDRIFEAAAGSNAILFFDEADALFGKRSEVRDSHDRYANIEVAYLLQKMESYEGAVILATNLRQNIDEAFLRRLDLLVDFPFPEASDRERIWRLVLPEAAPVADDIDIPFLATQFKLSGGSIRNASLAAAFLAAEDDGVIAMRHLVRGVALEYGKLGRLTLESEFEGFHELIRTRTMG